MISEYILWFVFFLAGFSAQLLLLAPSIPVLAISMNCLRKFVRLGFDSYSLINYKELLFLFFIQTSFFTFPRKFISQITLSITNLCVNPTPQQQKKTKKNLFKFDLH
jgi:hypothetical protein